VSYGYPHLRVTYALSFPQQSKKEASTINGGNP